MKTRWLIMLLFTVSLLMHAEEDVINVPELILGAQEWAAENLDTNLLPVLFNLDEQKMQPLLLDLQKRFQGEYIVNLAALRESANAALPLLENDDETRPYAAWLRSRLDYLKIADEFQFTISPPPVTPGEPARLLPNPSAAREREVWATEVAQRPWPTAVSNHVNRLKPIFAAEKIPPELVWLAEVESSFDAQARSPVGAAGLFQLMPDTAKRFGLSLWPRDERMQPEASARAAAQYLNFLYRRFKDWRLALAAYNSGEGTVDKLLKRHSTRNFDEIAEDLPAETQMFVPRVEAVILRREGCDLTKLATP